MTVPTSDNREDYTGNGATTQFDFAFKIFTADSLQVILTDVNGLETTLNLTTDYTVAGVGDEAGGTVTYPVSGTPLAAGETLTILRVLPLVQNTDLRNQGAYFPAVVEDEFDKSRMIDQQQQEELDRSLKQTKGSDDYDAGSNRIENLADAVEDTDAATKGQIDNRFSADVITKTGGKWDAKGLRLGQLDTADSPAEQDATNARWVQAYIASVISGGQGIIPEVFLFDGDGVTTTFSIPGITALDPRTYTVTIDGVDQIPTAEYTIDVAAETITFVEAPPAPFAGETNNIMVRSLAYKKAISEAQNAVVDTATGIQTIPEALDKRTIYVGSVAELEALSLPVGVNVYLTEEGRSGEGVIKSGVAPSDPQKGVYIPIANGNYWERLENSALTPEMFGYDGTASPSLQAAADMAAALGVPLVTGPGTYRPNIDQPFNVPASLVWISYNSVIQQDSTNTQISGIRFQGNSAVHIGKTKIVMAAAPSGNAYRGHVLFGDWETGTGPKDIIFGEFYCDGGHENINGVAFAGDCARIYGKAVRCGNDPKIGRLVMGHWANFEDHFKDGSNIYQHAVGATVTTHPHDIQIEEITAETLSASAADFMAVFVVSAGYNFTTGKVTGSVQNAGSGGSDVVLLTAGDLGFAYASAEDLERGMDNISIGTINGEASKNGINRIGRALFRDQDSTPQPAENYLAKIRETVNRITVKGAATVLHHGISGDNGKGFSSYGTCKASDFLSAAQVGDFDGGLNIESLTSIRSQKQAFIFNGTGTTKANWPESLSIGELIIEGTGVQATADIDRAVFNAQKVGSTKIGKIDIRAMAAGAYPPVAVETDLDGFNIDLISVVDSAIDAAQSFLVTSTATAQDAFNVSAISAPSHVVTPVNGGVTVECIGRTREYRYFGGTVPSGISVKVGDRFVAAFANSGQPWLSIVETAGVTGTDAVVTGYLVRA